MELYKLLTLIENNQYHCAEPFEFCVLVDWYFLVILICIFSKIRTVIINMHAQ